MFNVVNTKTNTKVAEKKSMPECIQAIYANNQGQSMTMIITDWPASQISIKHTAVAVQFNRYNKSDENYHIFENK